MTAPNPLVARAPDAPGALAGLNLVEPAADAVSAIQRGDWAEAGINVLGAGIDALGFLTDPFGTLLSSAFAWFIEHVEPLKSMLDSLAGNPGVINQNAATWGNVGDHLKRAGEDMSRLVDTDTAAWRGAAIDAYTAVAKAEATGVKAAGLAAEGVGAALTGAGVAVATVRTIVRDLISMAMSELVQALIRWAAAALLTVGLATPGIIADGIRLIMKWAKKVSDWLDKVIKTIRNLSKVVNKIFEVLEKCKTGLAAIMPKGAADAIVDTTAIGIAKNLPTEAAKADDSPYATR
ncbi:WXG100 family type VII secretion target [Lentzea sp. NPDC058450]|uniref:WXG100 family type VII secretion target n=1 Tax=Lentzea sp. NPDC058450 TaxID=3346505 RepID=UPI00365D0322